MLELFFAMFYASVNVGAVLCMWFIPMVRSKFYQFMMIFRMQRPIFVTFPLSTEENESLASLTRFTLVSRASRSKANVPRRHFEFNFFNSYYGMLRGKISMNLSLMDPMIAI